MSPAGGAGQLALCLLVLACCLAGGCVCQGQWDAAELGPSESGNDERLPADEQPEAEEGGHPLTVGALARRLGGRVASGVKARTTMVVARVRGMQPLAKVSEVIDDVRAEGYPDHEIEGPAEAELLALRRPSQFLPVPTADVFRHPAELPQLPPAGGSTTKPGEASPETPAEKPSPESPAPPEPSVPPTSTKADNQDSPPENSPPQPVEAPPTTNSAGSDRSALARPGSAVIRTSASGESQPSVVRFRRLASATGG
ncbi:MAG: hypothetical protein HYS13_16630 [Planctomycetia bacterium]|nr:hypothetical protein [Planctomycetia bacterium]